MGHGERVFINDETEREWIREARRSLKRPYLEGNMQGGGGGGRESLVKRCQIYPSHGSGDTDTHAPHLTLCRC
ncbi:hypothetical protein E2C01_066642 [Portunus trituberculatus]|uniref:Uncharacterized protein n=1 Tax=Portunus trituberculatus TaxID=210409 RepID=A0A5B7HUD5_PORTR|nr:hypothetical protein [Portunus trituberculatus]